MNLLTRMSAALADSEAGSVNPPDERLLVTGTPNIAQATITSTAIPMIRFGAAAAASAMRCSAPPACGAECCTEPSAMLRGEAFTFDDRLPGTESQTSLQRKCAARHLDAVPNVDDGAADLLAAAFA